MNEILQKVLEGIDVAEITGALVTAVTIIGGILAKLLQKKLKEITEKQNSQKRGSLRTEYLGIYNSDKLTTPEKYEMTRDIVRDYKALNGNHYIEALEKKLSEQLAEEIVK